MATWNTDKPAIANQISADIPDIEENFQELHDVIQAITNGTLGTTEPINFAVHQESRAIFTYNGGATAYTVKVKPGKYYCKEKYCQWTSELTTGAVGAPAGDTWYYLYLDYSAITSGTAITNSELIWSDTAPTYNTTYNQWMNGDDRCIFAVMTNSAPNNIEEFFHDGDYVSFADQRSELSGQDIDTTWTDVTLDIPGFSRSAAVSFYAVYSDGNSTSYWRTNGQTGTSGHPVGTVTAGSTVSEVTARVLTDATQIIEVKNSDSNGNTLTATTQGWYFPIGI